MNLIDFIFDFETRSRIHLRNQGVVVYATDPSTEATLLTYCFGRTGHIKVWRKGNPIPLDILDVAYNPEKYRFVAQNIAFDYLIWTISFARLIPRLRKPEIERIEDLMGLSCNFRTGASLESIAAMLNLNLSKDKLGRQLMLKSCSPRSNGEFYELTEEEYGHFERYGKMDTQILREAYYRLPSLPEGERWAWEWTFKRNLRGIRIDENLLAELISIVEEAMPKAVEEFNFLVGYKCKIGSPTTCKAFFEQYYPGITGMGADIVRDMLVSGHEVPWQVKRALEIKSLVGSTSIAKLKTAQLQKYSGRIYAILAFSFAQTKRWAGRGIQIHNFPRVDNKKSDPLDFDMDVHDLASVIRQKRANLKDPIGFVKNLLRRIWIPSEGKTFYCGDFAKVEPTVLFWLTGMGTIPSKWYEEMAAEIYGKRIDEIGKESEERQIGKMANLSCQYGTGWEGFRDAVKKDTGIVLSEEMAKQVINAYRRKNSLVVNFWDDLAKSFRRAIYGETTKLSNGMIYVMPMPSPWKGVQIRLPSGNYLYYHKARESIQEYQEEISEIRNGETYTYTVTRTRKALSYLADQGAGRVAWDYVYGGKLTENVVSTTSRDILIPSMFRLERAGFDVLNSVHDEIWAEAESGREEEFKRLMCIQPSWCDMDISAEVKSGKRYLK